MTNQTSQLTRVDIEHLPNFKRKTRKGEYSSSCPFCKEGGKDRFLFWPEKGNYLCRVCGAKGFISDSDSLSFTKEQYEAWKRTEQERKKQERKQELSIIEQIALSPNADRYHRQMIDRTYWYGQGLNDDTINRYKLGWCSACPTCPDSASWTIPIYYQSQLFNIRHRLISPNGRGKYRPEMSGLPPAIFNADRLIYPDWMTVIVEGEIKAMVLEQHGFPTIGIPGASSFKEKWTKLFAKCGTVYIALDPGANKQAEYIGELLKPVAKEVRICQLPVKPDDLFVLYDGTEVEFFNFLRLGAKI